MTLVRGIGNRLTFFETAEQSVGLTLLILLGLLDLLPHLVRRLLKLFKLFISNRLRFLDQVLNVGLVGYSTDQHLVIC